MISIRDEDQERLRRALRDLKTLPQESSTRGLREATAEIDAVLKSIDELGKEAPYCEPQVLILPKCVDCLTRTALAEHVICSVCYVNTKRNPSA